MCPKRLPLFLFYSALLPIGNSVPFFLGHWLCVFRNVLTLSSRHNPLSLDKKISRYRQTVRPMNYFSTPFPRSRRRKSVRNLEAAVESVGVSNLKGRWFESVKPQRRRHPGPSITTRTIDERQLPRTSDSDEGLNATDIFRLNAFSCTAD